MAYIGPGAAQVVPHVHLHIIPRQPLNQMAEKKGTSASQSDTGRSWVMFGWGQREELDEEEAVVLAGQMREELARELRRMEVGAKL
jgi:diadenosine tetraphosphate (Ap4A) HIT family hydrolase